MSERRILLVEQHPERGLDANIVIGTHLEEEFGHEVAYSLTGADLTYQLVRFQPHVVYFPWISPFTREFLRKRSDTVSIVNAFQEQFLMLDNPESEVVERAATCDYVCLWGDVFRKHADFSDEDVQYLLTGNPRFDVYFSEDLQRAFIPSREEMAARFGLDHRKRWALFALDFPKLFQSEQKRETVIDRGLATREYLRGIRRVYETLAEWLYRASRTFGDIEFILRPHPGSDLDQIRADFSLQDRGNVHYLFDGTINKWIINSDLYFTRFSTSIIEAWMCDKPAAMYVCDHLTPKFADYTHAEENSTCIESYREFEDFLESEHSNSRDAHREFIEDYFYRTDGRASFRTAEHLDRIARERPRQLSYRRFPLEDGLEYGKGRLKRFLNRSGINSYNPFPRPKQNSIDREQLNQKRNRLRQTIG